MPHFIDVILPIALEKLFTYAITESESRFIKKGIRVAVPFGKRKIYTAIVADVHQKAPLQYEAKEIHQILDESPVVTIKQLEFWQWISNYYMCSLGEVMKAALPSALILESETIISLNTKSQIEDSTLSDDEFLVYEALHHQSALKAKEIEDILDRKSILNVLKKLIEKDLISLKEEITDKYQPKLERYVTLNVAFSNEVAFNQMLDSLKRAPKQRALVLNYYTLVATTNKPVKAKDLLNKSKATTVQLKSLIDKNIFEEQHIQQDRLHFLATNDLPQMQLNKYQSESLNKIEQIFNKQDVVLLHGVTSSGKTEIYIKCIQNTILKNQQVLYLVPEIALTSQLINRLKQHFSNKIVVYHSRYSFNERVEVWNQVIAGSQKAQVILGARSAALLPFNNLGLIIVDEEHEQSYKQFDPAPRYHARDASIVLAQMFKGKVLLGSATPSLESYYNASKESKYGLVELKRRYNDVQLPEIELIDLADKQKRKRMTGHFSDRLIEELALTLDEGYQAILFQNRRGFAPIISCNTCGHSPQCPNCDVSLTYHQYRNQLRCHYCSHAIAMQQNCLACGSSDIDSKGFGTEQIEEEVGQLFPKATVGRMDFDTTKGKYGYDKIITAFEQHEIDVLVGTQMVTKGLDFRKVKLVGILNADLMLNFPDFRAHERSFQLMQQVAGRSGRTKVRGKVIIQTYNPYHKILQQVASHDYGAMFEEQLHQRYIYKYPPYYRMIRITLRHKDFNKVNDGADWMVRSLRQLFNQHVLGPEFPPIARIRNQYNKNILVKVPKGQSLTKTKEAILKIRNSFSSIKEFRPIRTILNVDYY